MKITAISVQARDKSRVNVSVDGRYRFSLDITQLIELGVRVGNEYNDEELVELERQSQFGKVYSRTLEYVLVRPRSRREVTDYLYRKTRPRLNKQGEKQPGMPLEFIDTVIERLDQKRHLDDERFARYWVENRNVRKGTSLRQLQAELMKKGVASDIIATVMAESEREDDQEIDKMIAKRYNRYDDQRKLIAYLAGKGFRYDTIMAAIERYQQSSGV